MQLKNIFKFTKMTLYSIFNQVQVPGYVLCEFSLITEVVPGVPCRPQGNPNRTLPAKYLFRCPLNLQMRHFYLKSLLSASNCHRHTTFLHNEHILHLLLRLMPHLHSKIAPSSPGGIFLPKNQNAVPGFSPEVGSCPGRALPQGDSPKSNNPHQIPQPNFRPRSTFSPS
ncbi:unnamed protein product, partial [Nesidiocoris tenuis]